MVRRVCEAMNSKKYSFLFLVIGFVMACVYGLFLYLQYDQISTYHDEQKAYTDRLVGKLVSLYPEDESRIVEAIIQNNTDEQGLGATILAKYGYDETLPFMKDDRFLQFINDSFLINGFLLLLLLILNVFVWEKMKRRNKASLTFISNQLTNFMNDDYTMIEPSYKEGNEHQMYSLLYQLGRKQQLHFEKLRKEKESLKELITDISHQVKTPISSLQLYNELLLDPDLTKEEQQEFLQSNSYTIEKLHNLSDALLNLSRLEIAMIQLNQRSTSMKALLVKAMNSAYPKSLQKNVELIVEDFDDLYVFADEKWTEESIFNVIDNAVKYTNPHREVSISVHSLVNFVRVDIADQGIGINKAEYNRIFQRFYRGNHPEIQGIEGSGVGLFLTRKIIEEQGGSIVVKSEEGVGTTFSLFLQKCKSD
ncbi:sensor histidine kinase [Bacillus sp. 1P06AnD]|uniref:sensor histidine kinase n=1 Tax=Bacillus sp. 1P06AnD TaxID=3132208 RepID=UPI0039A3C962